VGHEGIINPNPWSLVPFAVLLGAIALAPLCAPAWWGRHYPKVAIGLAAITLTYYLGVLHAQERVLHVGVEYVSFMALIGSLYVVSGGIHITVKGEATPLVNVVFLLVGAVIANVLGTTGASMLMIRPWLRMNKYRLTAHHVVFFVFLVSNVGGCLTPIGDPPLFLGYLKGIPFWWVAEHCWPMWAVGVGLLLAIFYVLDRRNYLRAPAAVRERLAEPGDVWRFQGLGNLVFLGIILGAVFLPNPPFLREGIMVVAAAASYRLTRKPVHEANQFNFHPIQEVAILFIGIFATMMPALDWLQMHAAELGSPTPGLFYWAAGALSSVLDNAPTYLSFLSAEMGLFVPPERVAAALAALQSGGAAGTNPEVVQQTLAALAQYFPAEWAAHETTAEHLQLSVLLAHPLYNQFVVALSVGAVFFGACTYIGNGPNFMVKSIAEQQKAHVPTFLGYVFRFTLPYLLPVLLVVWAIFFR
jgi:Na+/H+ antiporter NhaD/arsenite permease-like protein